MSDSKIKRIISDDIPEMERLQTQIDKWIASDSIDLEEVRRLTFKHICEYYGLNEDEGFHETEDGIKAFNMSWKLMDDAIYDLDVTHLNYLRLDHYISGIDSWRAYHRLINEFDHFLSPEEYKYLCDHANVIFSISPVDSYTEMEDAWDLPALLLQGIVTPIGNTDEGRLIKALSIPWEMIVRSLSRNWEEAFNIPPDKWEELIAASFHRANYDEVILTPRSGDHGRDVIATKHGFGSIRIIGSVKAYKPRHLVSYDDVRALIGVLHGDRQASKGIITTTSDFPPGIMKDPFIQPFVPYRLEMINGKALKKWLEELLRR